MKTFFNENDIENYYELFPHSSSLYKSNTNSSGYGSLSPPYSSSPPSCSGYAAYSPPPSSGHVSPSSGYGSSMSHSPLPVIVEEKYSCGIFRKYGICQIKARSAFQKNTLPIMIRRHNLTYFSEVVTTFDINCFNSVIKMYMIYFDLDTEFYKIVDILNFYKFCDFRLL